MIYKELYDIFGKDYLENVSMKDHTSFNTGGPAKIMLIVRNEKTFINGLLAVKKLGIDHFVLASCSNVLISDHGLDGAVFMLSSDFSKYDTFDNVIEAQAGITLSRLALAARDKSLTGLEFACGIPGSLGAAIAINAGAYGGQMQDVVIQTRYVDNDLRIKTVVGSEHDFGYRHSIFCHTAKYVLSAKLKLDSGSKDKINKRMLELKLERKTKQPLDMPSAGSVFKRPVGYFAGKLIQDVGLMGYSIGDAQVSTHHAGFIINKGEATSSDIYALIEHVKRTVKDKYGVELENEVKLLGEFEQRRA